MIRYGLIGTLAQIGMFLVLCGGQFVPGLTPGRNAPATTGVEVLQFTSAGHALKFSMDGVYLASGDHMLHESFVGATQVMPATDSVVKTGNEEDSALSWVQYAGLWQGIDLLYDVPAEGIVRSTYTIAPGADPRQIRLRYNLPASLEADGSLSFAFKKGHLTAGAPLAWQEINGAHIPIDVHFQIETDYPADLISFQPGTYNPAYALIIDPTFVWTAYLGGSDKDSVHAIAVGSNGNIYVTGASPTSWGSPIRAYSGNKDAFVARLDESGNLIWNTFLGSNTGSDEGRGIAVDASGNVFVTGESTAEWGDPVNAYAGGYDAFAVRLDSDGALVWSTFLGTMYTGRPGPGVTGADYGKAIAVDGGGNVYVTGQSDMSWGNPLVAYSGGKDAFLSQLDATGERQWTTFLGGTAADSGNAIATDGGGNVYVTGSSGASWGSPVNAYAAGSDIFAAKLDASGARQWNTFVGGAGTESGLAIAVDNAGNVVVGGGSTDSLSYPIRPFAGEEDALVVKLNNNGAAQWLTFLGGADNDCANAIAVDVSGDIFVGGVSYDSWGAPDNAFSSNGDGFVAKLRSGGALLWNTFTGDADWEGVEGVALGGGGSVYLVASSTFNGSTPNNPNFYSEDAYVTQIGTFSTLEVEGNTRLIASGDTSPDSADNTDFGSAAVMGGSVGNVFTLRNTGGDPLILSGSPRISLSGPAAADFKVLGNPFSPLNPNDQSDCVIQFDPSEVGLRQATVSIVYKNLSDPYTFSIQGNGTAEPGIEILGNGRAIDSGDTTPSTLDGTDFGYLPTAGSATQTFTIHNTGLSGLTLNGSPKVSLSGVAAGDFRIVAQPASPVPAGGSSSFAVSFIPSAAGLRQATLSVSNDEPGKSPYTFTLQGTAQSSPGVSFGANTFPPPDSRLNFGPSYITLEFDTNVKGKADAKSANTPGNYLLFSDGGDGFQTVDCAGGVASTDISIPIDQVFYDDHDGAGPFQVVVIVNHARPLAVGNYRLLVCGTTSIENLAGAKLNNGADSVMNFVVTLSSYNPGSSTTESGSSSYVSSLPATGFAPDVVSSLPPQPAMAAYNDISMRLDVPTLNIDQPIVGVPQGLDGWDVTWLGDQIGYLQGTAFPTWSGNSVLTGHVANANGKPGPFAELGKLSWGDKIVVHAWGQKYTYAVCGIDLQANPASTEILNKHESLSWLTLITCHGYDEKSNTYRWRTIVRAVLVSVE